VLSLNLNMQNKSNEDLVKVCVAYGLGDYIDAEKNDEGTLNQNSILNTSKGKFFIKSIREKRKESIPFIYGVESFFKARSIPVVSMMETLEGDISLSIDGIVYTVYKYLESDRSHIYSDNEYYEMGKLLGEIHKAGSKDVPLELQSVKYSFPAKALGIEKFLRFKKLITDRRELTDIDQLFLKYLDLKLSIASELDEEIEFTNDTLVHGDYHPGNLLFDKDTREIIGVCDWEQAGIFPRAYEVARSIMYVCFLDDLGTDNSIRKTQYFLKGYNSIYPISIEELQKGFVMRLRRMSLSAWIEEHYYERHDDRANQYVPSEIKYLNLFVKENLDIKRFF
jgi:Ser/Thr protein kinase RdoA (MazF antagonist)